MLWPLISGKRLEVDKAKIKVVHNLPLPVTLQELWSIIDNVGFDRRFIQDFAKLALDHLSL